MKLFGRKRVEKRTGAMGAWIGGCDARAGHGNSSVEVELVPQLRLGWLPRGWKVEGRIGRGWPASAKPKARRQPANTAAPHRFWPCGARTNRLPRPLLPLHFTANAMAHWLSSDLSPGKHKTASHKPLFAASPETQLTGRTERAQPKDPKAPHNSQILIVWLQEIDAEI